MGVVEERVLGLVLALEAAHRCAEWISVFFVCGCCGDWG